MTTIALRDGILAADSRIVSGGWIWPVTATKLHRAADGRIFACCGDYTDCLALTEWLKGDQHGTRPTLPAEGGRVIEMHPGGRTVIYEGPGMFDMGAAPFMAWGSGSPAALGAMYAGASAVEAVRIAARLDGGTGGRVRWLRADVPAAAPSRSGRKGKAVRRRSKR